MNKLHFLTQKILTATSYIPHSRIHPLKTLVNGYVKRDDELGFGISGSKWRKYTSLIPHLLQHGYKEAIVIGSAYSNHVLGISQLLIENSIKPTLFLLGDPNAERKGNLLLTSLLVPDTHMHWISRTKWPHVETLAAAHAEDSDLKAIVIPEGGCMDAALPGALTLALDILQTGQEFQHIFIDAGTGLTAIATILAFRWLNKEALLHVLLLADNEKQFLFKLQQFQQTFESLVEETLSWPHILSGIRLHRPTLAPSFGSVNSAVIKHIGFLAREEGFFTDPIYSAKLFWEAQNRIITESLAGNVLVIHSGGALTLMGFQEELYRE